MLKRTFDLLVAMALICTLLPIILSCAMAIRVLLGAPVLFRQVRIGQHNVPFTLIKFRTMKAFCGDGDIIASDNQRMTRLGSLLRASSLDELPSLWNVVKGDMSLVGPRPLLEDYLPLYSKTQARRHEVKPGITGWAQVNGRNAISWERKFELDVWYVLNNDFALDCRILYMTLKRVVTRDGITANGHVTNFRFEGSKLESKNQSDKL